MALINLTSFRSLVKEFRRLNFLVETYLRAINIPIDKTDKSPEASLSYVDEETDAAMEVLAKLGKLNDKELRELAGEEEPESKEG